MSRPEIETTEVSGPLFTGPAGYLGPVTFSDCGLCSGWGYHDFGRCQRCDGHGITFHPAAEVCL